MEVGTVFIFRRMSPVTRVHGRCIVLAPFNLMGHQQQQEPDQREPDAVPEDDAGCQ